jgi:hypothetical protein
MHAHAHLFTQRFHAMRGRVGASFTTLSQKDANLVARKKDAMKWSKSDFKNSISGLLLRRPLPPSDSVLEDGIEDIREAMLDLLGDEGFKQYAATTRRIRYATDIKDLWYLRGDLMAALAGLHGETIAREHIAQVNLQFQGLLPGGLNSRPSPLGR